jgi:hypothetical protein
MTVYANFRDKPALLSAAFDRRIKLMRVHGGSRDAALAERGVSRIQNGLAL